MKFLYVFILAFFGALQFSFAIPVLESRITNGNFASPGQFAHQAGLLLDINASDYMWCGGSLIGRRWIVTAAHCTVEALSVTVYLGVNNRTTPEVMYTVSQDNIIVHSRFNSEIFENDIALIRIPPVTFSTCIQIIKLPSIASSYSDYVGENVIASGWGKTADVDEFATDYLRWARFKIISNNVCREVFEFLAPSSVCVSTSENVSTCNGDSGGPLVLETTGLLIGLTSFGSISGCEKGYPAAFTRLTSYLDWIKANTGISY